MTRNEAQHIAFEWSAEHKWRLCYDCQKELLRVLGQFFKIPERAAALRSLSESGEKKP